jgi:membrane protease YdiL (CAAX protease family)
MKTAISDRRHPWIFLASTLGLTWAFLLLAAGLQQVIPEWGIIALRYLGGLTPLAVAIGLVYRRHERPFQRDFWRRMVDYRRIGVVWFGVIFLYTPLKSMLAAAIDALLGGQGIEPETLTLLIERPALIAPVLFFWLIFGPVPEEPGWRGYALDGLQNRWGALWASLIVGAAWAVWHLPLFVIEGTWQAETVGLGTQRFWLYLFTMLVESILYTWIYTNTNRSTLSAILFHFMGNAFGELFALSERAEVISFMLAVVAVVCVVVIWGPKTLSGAKAS